MKVLIIRFSSIGDIVLTSPIVRCLKKQIPGVEVHYLTKSRFAQVLEFSPWIEKIHRYDRNFDTLIPELQAEKFDFVADLHGNLRSRWVRLHLRKPGATFPKLNFEKWLTVNLKGNFMPSGHIVDRYFEALAPLGVQNDQEGLDYDFCDCEIPADGSYPEFLNKGPFIAASIGGTHATKRMPAQKWADLLAQFTEPIVLLGGKEDRQEAERIVELCGSRNTIWNACGELPLGGSAWVLKQSFLVITHDTGLMHIASAFKKPIIAIWGNTIPELGMYPYQTPHFNLEVKGLSCRPCSKIGFKSCPKRHFRCMWDQDLNQMGLLEFVQKSRNA